MLWPLYTTFPLTESIVNDLVWNDRHGPQFDVSCSIRMYCTNRSTINTGKNNSFFGEKSMPVVFGAKLSFFSSSHFDSLCIKKKILYFLPKESLTQFSKIEFKWGFRFFVLILLPFFCFLKLSLFYSKTIYDSHRIHLMSKGNLALTCL